MTVCFVAGKAASFNKQQAVSQFGRCQLHNQVLPSGSIQQEAVPGGEVIYIGGGGFTITIPAFSFLSS